jgi:hypothetical protein
MYVFSGSGTSMGLFLIGSRPAYVFGDMDEVSKLSIP